MAHVKNVRGGPGDEDLRPLPRQPTDAKGKATKKLATKKHKYPDADTARVDTVAAVTDLAERGGARSGVQIAYQLSLAQRAAIEQVEHRHGSPSRTVMLEGHHVALEETRPHGEPQQQTEHTQEAEQTEETEQASQS